MGGAPGNLANPTIMLNTARGTDMMRRGENRCVCVCMLCVCMLCMCVICDCVREWLCVCVNVCVSVSPAPRFWYALHEVQT